MKSNGGDGKPLKRIKKSDYKRLISEDLHRKPIDLDAKAPEQFGHTVPCSSLEQQDKPVDFMEINDLKTNPLYIVVGKFGRTHGLDGRLFVHSYTQPAANLFEYKPLYLNTDETITILGATTHGKHLLCQVDGFSDCNHAKTLTNRLIYIHTDQLGALPEGQYYWHDLAGCTVMSEGGRVFGVIKYMYNGSQFPIMVIADPDPIKREETLIPYEPSTVLSVDIHKKRIVVNWLID